MEKARPPTPYTSRSSAPACRCRASTAPSGPTGTSTAPPRRPALPAVADRVDEFLPWYSSVHRGAGYKSRRATAAYEAAREERAPLRRAADETATTSWSMCRNTTEAINHLAYRLASGPTTSWSTTVVEHHANLLALGPGGRAGAGSSAGPTARSASTTSLAVLDDGPRPAPAGHDRRVQRDRLAAADRRRSAPRPTTRGVPVLVDAAQLAPHRPLPAGPDFLAFSGHKLYAPFGAGALIGPRGAPSSRRRPLPGRRRRGRPGRPRRGDLDRAARARGGRFAQRGRRRRLRHGHRRAERIGWDAIARPRGGAGGTAAGGPARRSTGVRVLGPEPGSAQTASPWPPSRSRACTTRWWRPGSAPSSAIGVRHGCFCAHPYLIRLLGVGSDGGRPRPRPRCTAATAAASRARSGPAAGSGPRPRTSTRCSTRCGPWPRASPRPSPTCRTPSPATSGPRATRAAGARRTDQPGPRAPAADRPRGAQAGRHRPGAGGRRAGSGRLLTRRAAAPRRRTSPG